MSRKASLTSRSGLWNPLRYVTDAESLVVVKAWLVMFIEY